MKIRLINGWRTWPKWWSTRLKILGVFLLTLPEILVPVWSSIPHDIKEHFPTDWLFTAGIFLVVASSVAQIVRQKKLVSPEKPANESDNHDAEGRGGDKK